jgi:hypothetical protein
MKALFQFPKDAAKKKKKARKKRAYVRLCVKYIVTDDIQKHKLFMRRSESKHLTRAATHNCTA